LPAGLEAVLAIAPFVRGHQKYIRILFSSPIHEVNCRVIEVQMRELLPRRGHWRAFDDDRTNFGRCILVAVLAVECIADLLSYPLRSLSRIRPEQQDNV